MPVVISITEHVQLLGVITSTASVMKESTTQDERKQSDKDQHPCISKQRRTVHQSLTQSGRPVHTVPAAFLTQAGKQKMDTFNFQTKYSAHFSPKAHRLVP